MKEISYCLEDVYRELYRRKHNIKVDKLRDIQVDSDFKKEPKKNLNSFLKLMGIDINWIRIHKGRYFYSFSEESFNFLVGILENATAPQSFLKNLRNKKSINPADLGQYIELINGFERLLNESDCPQDVIATRIAQLHVNVNYDELLTQSILFEIDQMLHKYISEPEEPVENLAIIYEIRREDQIRLLQWVRQNVLCYVYEVQKFMKQIRHIDLLAIKEGNEKPNEPEEKSNREQANEYAALNRTLPVALYREAVEFTPLKWHQMDTSQLAEAHYDSVLDRENLKDILDERYQETSRRYEQLRKRTADSITDDTYCYLVAATPSKEILEEAVSNIPFDFEMV